MTPADAAECLTLAAAYDNRTPSEVAARAWCEAIDATVALADAKRIIIEHYARTREWIMPADINAASASIRRARLDAADRDGQPIAPPEVLDGDPAAEIAWKRAYWRAIGDGLPQVAADTLACAEVGAIRRPQVAGTRPVLRLVQQAADALPRIPTRDAS